jgi:hypothetical protein
MFRRAVAFIASLMMLVAVPAAACGADSTISPGTVRFAKGAESSFDAYTQNPSAAQKTFMTSHYWRMRTYAPYFNSRLGWFADAWVYADSQAIYNPSSEATQHPDWILRDKNGNKLFLQFGCSGGTCPQYAADISNPDFRADWIAGARAKLAAGYKGLFVDDVNMVAKTGNGSGGYVPPVDPRTGLEMTDAVWQKYMADFMVQVRDALPGVEIVHNVLWPVPDTSADVQRELNAADYIELERGFNDGGITGGSTGYWSFGKLASFIDHRHAAGKGVILDGYADTPAGRLYGLATYFLRDAGQLVEGLRDPARGSGRAAVSERRRLAARLRARDGAGQRAGRGNADGVAGRGLPRPGRRGADLRLAERRVGRGAAARPDADRHDGRDDPHADPDAHAARGDPDPDAHAARGDPDPDADTRAAGHAGPDSFADAG